MQISRSLFLGVVLVQLVLISSGARRIAAADDVFLRIDGIEGEATDSAHANWIDVLGLGSSVTQSTATGGGGGGSARAVFSDMSIVKRVDRASPKLFVASAEGKHFPRVDIEFVRPGELRRVYYAIRLTDVQITGVRTNANATEGTVTEFVTFTFARINWTYTFFSGSGQASQVTGGWDVAANRAL